MRDRRAFLMAVVLPMVLFPVMMLGMQSMERVSENTRAEKLVRVGLDLRALEPDLAERLRAALAPDELRVEAAPFEADATLHDLAEGWRERAAEELGDETNLLVVSTAGEAPGPPRIRLVYDRSDDLANEARRRVGGVLRTIECEVRVERMDALLGGDPAAAVTPDSKDVAPRRGLGRPRARTPAADRPGADADLRRLLRRPRRLRRRARGGHHRDPAGAAGPGPGAVGGQVPGGPGDRLHRPGRQRCQLRRLDVAGTGSGRAGDRRALGRHAPRPAGPRRGGVPSHRGAAVGGPVPRVGAGPELPRGTALRLPAGPGRLRLRGRLDPGPDRVLAASRRRSGDRRDAGPARHAGGRLPGRPGGGRLRGRLAVGLAGPAPDGGHAGRRAHLPHARHRGRGGRATRAVTARHRLGPGGGRAGVRGRRTRADGRPRVGTGRHAVDPGAGPGPAGGSRHRAARGRTAGPHPRTRWHLACCTWAARC